MKQDEFLIRRIQPQIDEIEMGLDNINLAG